MQKKKIMILGAGPAQLPLFRAAKELGCEAVAATIPGPYPGIAEADSVSYTDITAPEAVAKAAQDLGVSAVASCCSEICLPALACACERASLPGITPAAAEISVNKLSMHRAFDDGNVTAPRYRVLKNGADLEEALSELGFPMVVKAVDLFSSRGVYVVRSEDEARAALESSLRLSSAGYALAEEFIDGLGFCVEAFVQNRQILFILPDGNLTIQNPGRPAVPVGHYAPLDAPEDTLARIRAAAEHAIRACGFDNCAVNMDMVLRDGVPYVIELTARAGATALSELISTHFGVDYYRMILLCALGEDVRPYFAARPAARPAAARMLTSDRSGVVRRVTLPEKLPAYVRELTVFAEPGDRVRAFENAGDRIGQLIVTGRSVPECLDRVQETIAAVRIEWEET